MTDPRTPAPPHGASVEDGADVSMAGELSIGQVVALLMFVMPVCMGMGCVLTLMTLIQIGVIR